MLLHLLLDSRVQNSATSQTFLVPQSYQKCGNGRESCLWIWNCYKGSCIVMEYV